MKRQILSLTLGLLLVLAVGVILSRLSRAEPAAPLRTLHSSHHFLPPYPNPRDRFGFDVSGSLSGYDVAQLGAGWYSNWGASLSPAHPDGLTYVQLIRFHAGANPYDPAQVTVKPSREVIAQIAAEHPGSLWFMSNEPDSVYQGDPIYPDVYAHVYHDFYTYIKELDPAALIANGGIVQPTPCRLEYLDIVWDTYQQTYGESMPVDVWNTHAFILREVYNSWGASTPPGVDPSCAMDYPVDDGDNIDVFWGNIRAMREWMKAKGYQDRPLIVSEYGVLWPEWFAPQFTPQRVSHFMTQTFDLFLYEMDLDIGYPADDYRLVQAWAWYSLSDDRLYNGYLFYSDSKELSPMGQAHADYTAALTDTSYTDLAVHRSATLDTSPLENLTPGVPYETTSATLPILLHVTNLGKLPANDVLIVTYLPNLLTNTVPFPARYAANVTPLTIGSIVLTQPARYDLDLEISVVADPDNVVNDPRVWNNTMTSTMTNTVDARPDLVISTMAWSVHSPGTLGSTLNVTLTSTNSGLWPSPPVSGTLTLSNTHGTLLLPAQYFPIPVLGAGAQAVITEELTPLTSHDDVYRLALEVDSAGVLDEQDEGNNRVEMTIPIVVTTTLQPDAASVLTSTSGRLAFVFPAGTVTMPTEIRFTPLLTSELPPDPPLGVFAFGLTAYRGEQPVSLTPLRLITVTWQYTDTDVAGLDEDNLGLYHVTENSRWLRVSCPTQQRHPEVNRLNTCIHRLDEYVFGQRYDWYLPLILANGAGSSSKAQWSTPGVLPGLPLRLPPGEDTRPRAVPSTGSGQAPSTGSGHAPPISR